MKKNNLFNILKIAAVSLVLGIAGCQKSNNNDTPPAPAPVVAPPPPPVTHQYGYQNGLCFDLTTNTQVTTNFCSTSVAPLNNGYRWNGTSCVNVNGQIVEAIYCQSNGGLNNSYPLNNCGLVNGQPVNSPNCQNPNQCNGLYYSIKYSSFFSMDYYVIIQCYASFCKGKTLIEYYSGREVVCQ